MSTVNASSSHRPDRVQKRRSNPAASTSPTPTATTVRVRPLRAGTSSGMGRMVGQRARGLGSSAAGGGRREPQSTRTGGRGKQESWPATSPRGWCSSSSSSSSCRSPCSSWSTCFRGTPRTPSSGPTRRPRTSPRSTASWASTSRCGSSTSSGWATSSRATWGSPTRRTSRRRASSPSPSPSTSSSSSSPRSSRSSSPSRWRCTRRVAPTSSSTGRRTAGRSPCSPCRRSWSHPSWCSSSRCTGTSSRARPPTCP